MRVMHRLFWARGFDREEEWLNTWAARGWTFAIACGFVLIARKTGRPKRERAVRE